MGDASLEVTEENQVAAQTVKSKAMDAISEGMTSACCDIWLLFMLKDFGLYILICCSLC